MVQNIEKDKSGMEKKVILITGASGGMGKELTNWFIGQGYALVLQYFQHPLELDESDSLLMFKADLRDENQIHHLVKQAIDKFGKIDVLINNAGVSKSSISWKMDFQDWKETMAINLDAPFLLSKAVIPFMRNNNQGRIINISSVVAQSGFVGTASYAASKAGLFGLTKTMAKELAGSNITVNALALGYFNTGMIEDVPAEIQENIIDQIPMKKLGDPQTVGRTIDWLISQEAEYITGQVINLNGGMYA